MKVTIELPETVEVASGEYTAQFAWSKLPKESLAAFVARAACVGVAKAGNDSASGAKAYGEKNKCDVEEARSILIDKWIAARYESGDFGAVRGAGNGYSELDREMIALCRPKVKAMLGDEKYKALGDEKDAEIVKYIESLDAKTRDGLAQFAQSEIDRKAAAKARREALDLPELDL